MTLDGSCQGSYCGPYLLDTPTGSVSNADCYAARHREQKGKTFTARVLSRAAAAERGAPTAFKKEFDLLKSLDETGIPKALRFGEVKERPCYITEAVQGPTLHDLLMRGAIGDPLEVLVGMTRTVAACHRRDVVVGHVHPEAFVVRQGDRQVFLNDFGRMRLDRKRNFLTQLLRKGSSSKPRLNLAFAAPEVAAGKEPDKRSDVHALGSCAFFLHTDPEILEQQLGKRSLGTTTKLRGAVADPEVLGKDLGRMVETCLRKQPEGRPDDAVQLLEQLEQIQSNRIRLAMSRAEAAARKSGGS